MTTRFRIGQIKAAITKLKTFLNEYTDSAANQAKLSQRVENLKQVIQQLPILIEKLIVDQPDDQEDYGGLEDSIMEDYMDVLAEAELRRSPNNIIQADDAGQANQIPLANYPIQEQSFSKIPKLELRKFDGSIELWKSFSDWFQENVHKRNVSDSTKRQYLHDTLTGEAAKTIAGFDSTSGNYKEAWELLALLELTYNNDRVITFRYFELFMAIPKMRNSSSESVRQLVTEIQVQIRKLKVMNHPVDQWDVPLVYITLTKMDDETKREWNRKIQGTRIPTFEELITFLREEATRLQTSNINNTNATARAKSQSDKIQPRYKQTLTTTIFKNCPICEKGGHPTHRCDKLLHMKIPQRINAVKLAKLCFNCLRGNHRTNECNRGNCFKCNKHHHTTLHLEKPDTKNNEQEDTNNL